MRIVLIVLLILVALVLVLGYVLSGQAVRIKAQTLEEARKWQEARYDLSWYDAVEHRDYEIKSYDGYVLHVQLLPNPASGGRYIILSHGYTDNRIGSLKYARMYLELGFNVIIYDLRGHGLNAPTYCTYSVREGRDLDALIRDTRDRYGDIRLLGLHGESLGAATTVAALKYKPQVDFAVADCGFAEVASILRAGLKGMHLPGWLLSVADPFARLRYGCDFSQMRPIDSLADNDVPILFIHGDTDGFIPYSHSEDMCRAAGDKGELRLIPGAKHAASIFTDPENYQKYVGEFIAKVERSKG